jgi:hypothetical protein
MPSSSANKSTSFSDSERSDPIRRESVVHHKPSHHELQPNHGALKVRRQSQSVKQEYSSHSLQASEHSESSHSHVKFDSVEVVGFNETVGLDVVPASGVPLQLGDDEVEHCVAKVDDFEEYHEKHHHHRVILKMSKAERERKLREQGISSEEFSAVEKELAEIRISRQNSAKDPESELKARMAESKRKLAEEKKKKKGALGRLNPFARIGGKK